MHADTVRPDGLSMEQLLTPQKGWPWAWTGS